MNKRYLDSLTEIADQLGLEVDSQTASIFGRYKEYTVCLEPISQTYQFTLNMTVNHEGSAPDLKLLKHVVSTSKALSACTVKGYRVSYSLRNSRNAKKAADHLKDALETVADYFHRNGLSNCCQSCGKADETDAYYIAGTNATMCPDCFTHSCGELAAKEVSDNQKKENMIGGIVGALLGSLLGVAAIIILGQLGYVAALSGVVLGVCTLKGYEILGRRLTTKGIIISIIIMIMMVYAGNRADWAISAANYFDDLDIVTSFQIIPELVREDYIEASAYYGGLAMVYMFTLLGAVPTIIGILRERKQANVSYKMGAAKEMDGTY